MKTPHRLKSHGIFIFLVIIGLAARVGSGATHTVGSGGEFSTIQAAIDDAGTVDGDTITIAASTYTEVNIIVSKNLTIQGAGTAETIVQAHAVEGSAANRVFTIPAGKTVSIREMTIRHGVVNDNSDAKGGGIYSDGTLTLSKVKLCNNQVTGGSYGCVYGGGLYAAGTTTVDQCTFANNLAQGDNDGMGGGAYVGENQIVTFTRCTFSGNTALGGPGGEGSGLGYGGGISDANTWHDPAVITIVNCTFSGNTSSSRGGGVAGGGATMILKHCTIVNNSAPEGGGIHSSTDNDNTGPILYHTIVANNTGTWGADFICRIQSRGYNLIKTDDGNGTIDTSGNGNTAVGNIIGSDPLLSALADNGGPTQTCALGAGSPAIDQIPNSTDGLGVSPLDVDQRGFSRPIGTNVDIGACEYGAVAPTVTTTAVSDITATTASSGGNVTADGGAPVTARGVCWSTTGNPTIADSTTVDGSGTGSYTSSITGLAPGTTYHVRAYATNFIGTSYGTKMTFATPAAAPTVASPSSASIDATSATLGGNVTATGGANVTERGIYWSTASGFTPPGQGTKVSETGSWGVTGAFTLAVNGLPAGTPIYFKAFAANAAGAGYSNEASFNATKANQTISFGELAAKTVGDGAFGLTATASSGLTVNYASSNTNVATVVGSTVTIVGAGTTTITASQAGNGTYNPAGDVQQTLTVNAAPTPTPTLTPAPTITPTPLPTPTPIGVVTDSNGTAAIQSTTVQVAVGGFLPNLPVSLVENGTTQTLQVGPTDNAAFSTALTGATAGTATSVQVDSTTGQSTVQITQPSGRRINIVLVRFPDGAGVGLNLGTADQIVGSVTHSAGQALNADIAMQDTGGDITFIITYHPPQSNGLAKRVWLAPGGSMTIEATGVPADGIYKLSISYADVPLGQTSAGDLRLMKVNNDGRLIAAGTVDRGDTASTTALGDYGIDTGSKRVWANVNTLGRFAVGVPKEAVAVTTTTVTGYGCPILAWAGLGVFGLCLKGLKIFPSSDER